MAINSIGRTQADTAGFIPQVWAQEALKVLRAKIVMAKIVARDSEFEPGWKGKTLNIPYPGTFTAQDKTEGNPATVAQSADAATVSLTLSKHKYVDFLVEDWAQAQANTALIQRYSEPAAVALAEALEKDLFSLLPSFTSVQTGSAGSDMDAADIRTLRKLLNDAKNPEDLRSVVFSSKDEISLMADTSLESFFAFANAQTVKNADLPPLYGMRPYMSQLVPVGAYLDVSGCTAGTFTLTYAGQTTSAIAYNASAATIKTAVEALSTVGSGKATVTATATGKFAIMLNIAGSTNTSITIGTGSLTGTGTIKDAAINFAMHRNAILLATRPLIEPPQDAGVRTTAIVDDISGIALRVQYQYSMDYRGVRVGFDLLYGFTKLRDVAGVVMIN